ncbi:MAG: MFS transporter [Dehalococcoidales bacterium]|nr:MFS transporter [Dehalococcoidales bacterium]
MAGSVTREGESTKTMYRGWVVVIAGFIIWTVVFGIQNSFGIFFKPLQETFGWSRATTSWAITTHLIVYALCMMPGGWAMDRFNTRLMYSIAAVLIGSSLILSSRITEPWQLYLVYGLPLGAGISLCGPAIFINITRSFTEKRGLALGIASAGVGFGTLVMAPLSNVLITSYGWRNAFVVLGIIAFVTILVCGHIMKFPTRKEIDEGQPVSKKPADKVKAPASARMTLVQIIRSREMFFIIVATGFNAFTMKVVITHIAPYATDMGISAFLAALAVGTIGGVSTAGRLIMGFVQDKIGPQRVMIICMTVQGFSMVALPFIGLGPLFFLYTIVYGFTYGGDIPQIPAITAQCFGLASMGIAYTMVQTVGNLAGALGSISGGFLFDLLGSYTVIFLATGVSLFTGAFLISRLKPRQS